MTHRQQNTISITRGGHTRVVPIEPQVPDTRPRVTDIGPAEIMIRPNESNRVDFKSGEIDRNRGFRIGIAPACWMVAGVACLVTGYGVWDNTTGGELVVIVLLASLFAGLTAYTIAYIYNHRTHPQSIERYRIKRYADLMDEEQRRRWEAYDG